MTCQAAMERMIEAAGRPAAGPEFEDHLRGCVACAARHAEQLALWGALDEWTAPEVTAGFDARLTRRLEGSRTGTAGTWLGRWFGPVQPAFAGALACLLLLAGVVLDRSARVPPEPKVAVWDREELRQMDTALEDLQMLNDFEILPVAQAGEGKS